MKLSVFLLVLLVLGGVVGAVFGGQRWLDQNRRAALADKELQAQKTELTACDARLKRLYTAWRGFRRDHGGADPPSVEAMMPRYLKDPRELMCPTAVRWTKGGGMVAQGIVRLGNRNLPETYGFKWLAPGYMRMRSSEGDGVPLIVCEVHREVLYRTAYKKAPPVGAFDLNELEKLVRPVANAPIPGIRKSGSLAHLKPTEL